MDSIDIIKPLSTVLSNTVNKSQQCRESNPGPLGAKRERSPLCYAAPSVAIILLFRSTVMCYEIYFLPNLSKAVIFFLVANFS